MAQLQVIEHGLVPVYASETQERFVSARDLHEFLQSGWQFSDWIQDRIRKYGLVEGQDFFRETCKTPGGGRPRVEYWLRLDTAKELAMVENNERGRQVRRYFIEVERRYRQMTAAPYPIPRNYAEALRLAADLWEKNQEQQAIIAELTPKAEFHDRVAEAVNAQSIREVAKVLGTGQNRLFRWLREQRILMRDNRPYQEYLDRGYFRVIEQTWTNKRTGEEHIATKTLVTGKGLIWLQRLWQEAHALPAKEGQKGAS